MNAIGWLTGWWTNSLRRRLLSLNIITTLLFLTLLGSLSFYLGFIAIQKEVGRGNRRIARIAAIEIRDKYDDIISIVCNLCNRLAPQAHQLSQQASMLLELRYSAPLTYRGLYLFDRNGHLLIHMGDPLGGLLDIREVTEILERPPFASAEEIVNAYEEAKSGELFLSGVRISSVDRLPVVYMGIPLAARENNWDRIVVAEIDLRDIWRKIDEVFIGDNDRVFVISEEGVIIAHPDRRYIGEPAASALLPVLSGYEGQCEYIDPVSRHRMAATYTPVGRQSSWGIVVEQERAELLTSAARIAYLTLVVLLAAGLMAAVVNMLIARNIIKPVQHLAEITLVITQTGELDQEVPVKGKDEVGQLAASFNRMITGLHQAREEIKQYSERLEEMVEERTRELEEAQVKLVRREKLAILGQLAGGLSHELRNPLAVISNAAYFLRETLQDVDEKAREHMELISLEVRDAERIVSDLLGFARTRVAEKEITTTVDLVAPALEKHPAPENVHVTIEIPPDLPSVYVDPRQIILVLGNLVINACQAMPEGGRLTVSASAEGDWVRLAIADTGCGISKEAMDKLFEPLFTTKRKGIGLGLALSRNLAEANGGSIEVDSEAGKGSTFTVILPIKEMTGEETA